MSAQPTYPCTVRERRAGMTDAEFWADVFPQAPEPDADDFDDSPVVSLNADPCIECGESGACGYDAEGRALIHVTDSEDD